LEVISSATSTPLSINPLRVYPSTFSGKQRDIKQIAEIFKKLKKFDEFSLTTNAAGVNIKNRDVQVG
jgi:hypothetical protein